MNQEGDGQQSSKTDYKAYLALFGTALGAVGLSGDLLARVLRNQPLAFGSTMAFVVVLVTILVALRATDLIHKAVIGALGASLAAAVVMGAHYHSMREIPWITVSVSSAENDPSRTVIAIQAGASGLKSSEQMLVQLQGMRNFDLNADARRACETYQDQTNGDALSASTGVLLTQLTAGPDEKGTASVEFSVQYDLTDYTGICGWAALQKRPGQRGSAIAYVRLQVPS